MKVWSEVRSEEGEAPRCIEDVNEPEFAEMLYSFAEELHLDKCVDTAFVGTEEAQAEEEVNPIDEVYGPEDEAIYEEDTLIEK